MLIKPSNNCNFSRVQQAMSIWQVRPFKYFHMLIISSLWNLNHGGTGTELLDTTSDSITRGIYGSLQLKCRNWDGRKLTWLHNGKTVYPESTVRTIETIPERYNNEMLPVAVLNIRNLSKSDAGVYECFTANLTEQKHFDYVLLKVKAPCDSMPCMNGARCLDASPEKFECGCLGSWSGLTCDTKMDPCVSQPCSESGTCFSYDNTYACVCPHPHNFFGGTCTSEISTSCSSSPCTEQGTCEYSDMHESYTCLCPSAMVFHNGTCIPDEIEVHPCNAEQNKCHNRAKCIAYHSLHLNKDTIVCDCHFGLTGEFCESIVEGFSDCDNSPCQNNGTCIYDNEKQTSVCICPPPFTGSTCCCETELTDCSPAVDDCANGARCLENINTGESFCVCDGALLGRTCEAIDVGGPSNQEGIGDAQKSSSRIVLIIVALTLILLLVGCSGLMCVFLCCKKDTNLQGNNNSNN